MRVIVAAVMFLFSILVHAQEWKTGGHVKYQYTHTNYQADDVNAAVGDESAGDHSVDLRLKADGTKDRWDFSIHYELLALKGDTVATRQRVSALGLGSGSGSGLPDDRRRFFDLTQGISEDDRYTAVHRLDRFSAGYTTETHVVRAGRQAVSWGNGLVFHPLDFVNPFSPAAIDKDYKTGDDMLFVQRALSQGDLQAIALPRRDPSTHEIESAQGSYAVKLRRRMGGFDVDFLAARHFDENLFGIGIVRSVGGAVWRFDTSYTDLVSDDGAWSFVTNLDYSWSWFDRNVYGYVEYFRNGVGEHHVSGYVSPSPALTTRVERGELFTLGRDYLALGVQIELSPLVNIYTSVIRNLNDGSEYLQLRGVYDWQQDIQLMAGVNVPQGDRGEEFGGIPVAGTPLYAATGRSAFLRVAYYF